MPEKRQSTGGPTPFDDDDYDFTLLPGYDNDFIDEDAISAFARALLVPESPSDTDLTQLGQSTQFITALNDWKPIRQRTRKDAQRKKKRRPPRRGKDETREGYVYTLLKWPLFVVVMTWIICLGAFYLLTRFYIYSYEHYVTMRGRRQRLRKQLQRATTYEEWVKAAQHMDDFLGNEKWKEDDDYAYYNSHTIRTVTNSMGRLRAELESSNSSDEIPNERTTALAEELRSLLEASVKNNFVGTENSRMYSETYFGTKNLVQDFVDEVEKSLSAISDTTSASSLDKATLFRHLHANYGRTALCLSGGATFAYYHFGVAKALLDADVLPEVITGTSGGALVAALLATRTDDELRQLLVPALANRIRACGKEIMTFARIRRWWRTGASFDSIQWAKACSWFCYGSLTFREAYTRTGRILNVTCIPSDPHSPTVLANYLTSPDCVVWSAVLASAAVPGILNPVVLMKKTRSGQILPFSFGHRWKDGSLRTDIPLRSLNTHFNVTFSIVSQVNPHINLFFFSSRGTVGRPVSHRRGRGWRGGFLGSATEQYLKLDLTKWLKVLRHLELLPRYLGQDWSEIWLQRFSGTITIWPKSKASDFLYILSDPPPERLARMIHAGQQSCWPKLKFVVNRMKVERLIEEGVKRFAAADEGRPADKIEQVNGESDADAEMVRSDLQNGIDEHGHVPSAATLPVPSVISEDDLHSLLRQARAHDGHITTRAASRTSSGHGHSLNSQKQSTRKRQPHYAPRITASPGPLDTNDNRDAAAKRNDVQHTPSQSPSISERLSGWLWRSGSASGGGAGGGGAVAPGSPATTTDSASFYDAASGIGGSDDDFDDDDDDAGGIRQGMRRTRRESSVLGELGNQSRVFFGDDVDDDDDDDEYSDEDSVATEIDGSGVESDGQIIRGIEERGDS